MLIRIVFPILQTAAIAAVASQPLLAQLQPDTWWGTIGAPAILGSIVAFLVVYDRPRERREAKDERDKVSMDTAKDRASDRSHHELVIRTVLDGLKELQASHLESIRVSNEAHNEAMIQLAKGLEQVAQAMASCARITRQ